MKKEPFNSDGETDHRQTTAEASPPDRSPPERREAPPGGDGAGVPRLYPSENNCITSKLRKRSEPGQRRNKIEALPEGCVSVREGIGPGVEAYETFDKNGDKDGSGVIDVQVCGVYARIKREDGMRAGQEWEQFLPLYEVVSGQKWNSLTAPDKKKALCLFENVKDLIARVGINNVGFETFTFRENLTDMRKASRKWHSFATNYYSKNRGAAIVVPERQKRGAVHFHSIADVGHDIKTGFDWEAVRRGDYRCFSPWLRSEIHRLRPVLKAYGFGPRHELRPIRSTPEAAARYVGGYIRKHIEARKEEDKGVRVVRYQNFERGERKWHPSFGWRVHGKAWRDAWGEFAAYMRCKPDSFEDMRYRFGKAWSYSWSALVLRDEVLLDLLGFTVGEKPLFEELVPAYRRFCEGARLVRDDCSGLLPWGRLTCSPVRLLKLVAAADGREDAALPSSVPTVAQGGLVAFR